MIHVVVRIVLTAGALLLAANAHAQAAGATEVRRYMLADRGFLVLPVPAGWKEQVHRRDALTPPAINYRPESGPPFEVLVTPIGPTKDKPAGPTPGEVRAEVQRAAEGVRSRAVEKSIAVIELKGASALGYYFRATDRAPKPGEFKLLTQGMVEIGELRVMFTILTNDGQRAAVDAALEMLRSARHDLPRAATRPPAKGEVLPPPDRAKLQALLEAEGFEQLDAELAAFQAAYRNGAIGDEAAARAFIALMRGDPDLRPKYDKWIAAKPDSYVARVARAYYLTALAYLARGSASVQKTSRAQFDEMRSLLWAAAEDLRISLRLDAKPVLGCGTMIWIAQGIGSREHATNIVNDAIGLDPMVYTARAAYLASLRPEWGGSLEQMELALATWKKDLDEGQLRRLGRMVEDAKWRTALTPAANLYAGKQFKEAIELYTRALDKAPVARAFAMRGGAYAELGQYDKAIEDFNRALELDPDGECCSGTRSSRGRAYLRVGAVDKALADFLLAAENDDAFATRELSVMYAFGKYGIKRDYVAARRWCERSAKQGDGLSMYCMGSLLHAGLGVPKDAKGAARWFEGAAKRGVADAQADLAYMLWHGQGVAQDREQAIQWWLAAAKQGNARAKGQLEGNLSWWEYFSQVTVPAWIEGLKKIRRN